MTNHQHKDTPGVKIPPPLIVIGLFITGLVTDRYFSTSFGDYSLGMAFFGWALVGLAVLLNIWCFAMYWNNKTSILPHTADNTLMSDGPFSFSRNPIYLCMLMLFAGLCAIFDAPLALIFIIPAYLALRYYVIQREEAYLLRRFGQAYLDYKQKVRRWI